MILIMIGKDSIEEVWTVTGTSTSTGMTRRHEQFLKNHNMTQPVRHGSSTLNEVSLLPRTAQVNSLSMMKPNSNVLYIYIYQPEKQIRLGG